MFHIEKTILGGLIKENLKLNLCIYVSGKVFPWRPCVLVVPFFFRKLNNPVVISYTNAMQYLMKIVLNLVK